MRPETLRWQRAPARIVWPLQRWLFVSHLAALVCAVAVILGTGAFASDLRNQTRWDLEHQGAILALHCVERVRLAREQHPAAGLADVSESLSRILRQTKDATLAGIRITDPDGIVVATSGTELGEDLAADEVVAAALAGRAQVAVRPRPETAGAPLRSESRRAAVRLFVAVPVHVDGERLGVIVLSRTPREELQALVRDVAPEGLWLGLAGSLAATLGLSLGAGWVLSRSLRVLAHGADRISEGAFEGIRYLEDPAGSHVAEVASLAGSVRAMTQRLRHRLGYISEFASNVSHEFKTPLATLRGTVELLGDDDAMSPRQRARFLANATHEIERLERLVDGLLALARAEEAGELRPIALGGLAGAVAARHAVPFAGPPVAVRGDPAQLETVVENLIRNALCYGAPPFSVRTWADGDRAGVEVSDGGTGISASHLTRVFDRFFTTDRAGGGTGLGLALVKAIVEAHGGRVGVESRPGRTVFRVVLPRASEPTGG